MVESDSCPCRIVSNSQGRPEVSSCSWMFQSAYPYHPSRLSRRSRRSRRSCLSRILSSKMTLYYSMSHHLELLILQLYRFFYYHNCREKMVLNSEIILVVVLTFTYVIYNEYYNIHTVFTILNHRTRYSRLDNE